MSHERLQTSHRSREFPRLEAALKPSDERESRSAPQHHVRTRPERSGAALEGFFIRSGILGTVGLMLIVWSMEYGSDQGVRMSSQAAIQELGQAAQVLALTEIEASGYSCNEIVPSRPSDKKYEGIYFFPDELNSFPAKQEGFAYYYGGGESLNTYTASGKIFDPSQLWAASWFYPFGTKLRVTDSETNDYVDVTVEDHGPNRVFRPEAIIDLTAGAYKQIDATLASGRRPVIVQPLCDW